LWITNGTAASTCLVKDIHAGYLGAHIGNVKVYQGELYFAADDGIHGVELWKTNGTASGTKMVADVNVTL